jgi:hypothetical protein
MMAMFAARYLYVLALVVWLGGIVALGLIAAPVTFQVLTARSSEGRAMAGAVFGEILRRFYLVTYAGGGLMLGSLAMMAILGPRPRAFAIRVAIVGVMLGSSLYSGTVITRQIQVLQQEIGTAPGSLPENDPRRARFGRLHGLSTMLMALNLVGGLVLLYWEATD